ncbi:MAG: hypothetical protein FWD31_08515, partial [Planctomycetaceae bacterium]|nr:hypothetical protein [Planctomycetaceae bacterium]
LIREANQPLIYAAYENHHTREIESDADAYLADKAQDISEVVRMGKQFFPELTDETSVAFVCHWLKRILFPNLRKACGEKVAYYTSQLEQNDISSTVKAMITWRRNKNVAYIKSIDQLAMCPNIEEKSSIFTQTKPK